MACIEPLENGLGLQGSDHNASIDSEQGNGCQPNLTYNPDCCILNRRKHGGTKLGHSLSSLRKSF